MQKIQKTINITLLLSETSHIFCCVLPTLVSLMSLLVGVGVIGSLPVSLLVVHDFLHAWELPIITGSGLIIVFGWLLYWYSRKMDCHDTGCGHGPCEPKKVSSSFVLKIATLLFIVNVSVYTVFHRGMGIEVPHAHDVAAHSEEYDHDHDHEIAH